MNKTHSQGSALNQIIDGFINSTIGDFVGSDFVTSHPRVNIVEKENELILNLAAPGLSKSEFNISLEKNTLTISANRNEQENEIAKYTRREFNYASFKRSFNLPELIDASKINASYENGILIVKLPKLEEAIVRNKTIEIS